ncbi:MAG TPA: beta-N-acetylglucosaminidase domain-containing protein [Sphingomonas sp.]|uniref:beta-N-acetylhexosaminidase family protein n=1 Tax=Sphingomonas sp. TaxID=28214 RepID=UPI002ED8C4DC
MFSALALLLAPMSATATPATLPAIFPAPAAMRLNGERVAVGADVRLLLTGDVDAETERLVRGALTRAGAIRIRRVRSVRDGRGTTVVIVGLARDKAVRAALAELGSDPAGAMAPEGYTLVSRNDAGGGIVLLAGHDGDGTYYAAQTLRQLVAPGSIAAVRIADHPATAIRGTIEGFYGKPWTTAARIDHLAFLGDVKANTYIYSPKDDPYARDRWRARYPDAAFADLKTLVDAARRHHVRFTYAISPGVSICYSDPADLRAIQDKFQRFHDIGVRSFYIALDDISYTKWNCDADRAALGAPGEAAAGRAQARFINAVQTRFADTHPGTRPILMVPTEYYDAKESAYKTALRDALDPRVTIQWTGTDVVPPAIAIADAKAATKAFGRPTLLWDNYPVNDYAQSAGRLLMAPYDRRMAGLADQLAGIVVNPMNQASASKIATFGAAAFAWNDRDYDADRGWHAAARYLAGDDPDTTAALLTFLDTQHLAPTFGEQPWQPQAPALKRRIDAVRDALADPRATDRDAALAALADAARDLATAPDRIRAGIADRAFMDEARPWLDALALWGRALQASVRGLQAAQTGGPAARGQFDQAAALAAQAAAIRSIPGATRPEGPIRVADGVLDRFILDAPTLIGITGP